MVPVYICDDAPETREYLAKLINNQILIHAYDLKIVLNTGDPTEVYAHRQTHSQRSIYFFDVDLQNKHYNGFTLAKAIRGLDPRGFLIFVSTHEELIYETFKYRLEAMNYINKDDPATLDMQVQACLKEVQQLLTDESDPQSYFLVKLSDSSYQIPVSEILFFETSGKNHRILLHTHNRILEFRGDLKKIEKQLGNKFLKIHRSYLVQVSQIEQLSYTDQTVLLRNGAVCLMSRRGKQLLKAYFQKKGDLI